MIVSDEFHFVYVAPPKTGSQSMRVWLINHIPDARELGHTHDMLVPEEYCEYSTFLTVRNPYDRVFSLWWFQHMDARRAATIGPEAFGTVGFEEYVRKLKQWSTEGSDGHQTCWAYVPLVEYKRRCGAMQHIHMEWMDEEIRRAFMWAKELPRIPHLRQSNDRSIAQDALLTDERRKLVRWYCPGDFKAFGYEE